MPHIYAEGFQRTHLSRSYVQNDKVATVAPDSRTDLLLCSPDANHLVELRLKREVLSSWFMNSVEKVDLHYLSTVCSLLLSEYTNTARGLVC